MQNLKMKYATNCREISKTKCAMNIQKCSKTTSSIRKIEFYLMILEYK